MTTLDWIVLVLTLGGIIIYGLYKSRNATTVENYLRAGRQMPWYAMALSIMATQASAITFISTTGQGYVDGMRFVQFYFGLPIAMILLSATAVPIFHRANVYTAYEYLEQRFDGKTRSLVSLLFLVSRGLGVGVALSAPAIVLAIIFGWSDAVTSIVVGTVVVAYTAIGGVQAVTWTDFQQMLIMFAGIVFAFFLVVWLMPADVSLFDALTLAGAAGRLNAVTTTVDWNDRYNLWSGLLGGMFLALAYFGTDQSQVQRYLQGKNVTHSRISLLFNGVVKIPFQFIILLVGALVFIFFTFEKPPLLFQPVAMQAIESAAVEQRYAPIRDRYDQAHASREQAARALLDAQRAGDDAGQSTARERYQQAVGEVMAVRRDASALAAEATGDANSVNDTNYIFLHFVTRYMPAGIVGLLMAAILAAAMSTISAEVNSLATVTVIDVYRRIKTNGSDNHYLWASRFFTLFWGAYAVVIAQYATNMGALIEVVNRLGSLFYGGMLGVFVLAFYMRGIGSNAAFWGVILGEAAIFCCYFFTGISFLWYNVIGCLVVVGSAWLLRGLDRKPALPV
ncbi:MAG: sodium:solute symporter [Bryobacterales bacterium]|jgi:SSS family transporter|nr:sodium:solute symporter [Bryobacterales bacterium]